MFPPNGPRSPSATSLSVRQSSTCTTPKTSTASRWKSELRRELLARFPSTSSPPSACVPKSSASRSTVAQQSFMSRRVASTSMSSCAFPCPPDHTRCAYASKTILDSPTIPPCPFSEPVPRACGSCPRLGHPPAIASRSACPASRGASTASPPGTPHRLSSSPVPSSQKGPLGELILSWSFRRTEPSSSPIDDFHSIRPRVQGALNRGLREERFFATIRTTRAAIPLLALQMLRELSGRLVHGNLPIARPSL